MKRIITGAVLTLGIMVTASTIAADDEGSIPPTAMDMVEKLKNYHKDPTGTSASIFDTGVLVNMRVPIEHLRVSFIDLRTEEKVSRNELRHILGQSRQDGMHELIREAFAAFPVPGSTNQEAMIDVFNAAAIASMRIPPSHISIEFYDARKGPAGDLQGGVSGRVPDYIYNPSKNTLEGEKAPPQSTDARSVREIIASKWNEDNIETELVDRGIFFTPQSANEFAMVFADTGENKKAIKAIVLRDFEDIQSDFAQRNEPFPLKIINRDNPVQAILKVDDSSEGPIYIGYVVFSSSDDSYVKHFRNTFRRLHRD